MFAGILFSTAWVASSEAEILTTSFAGNETGDEGYQFDVAASRPLVITGIQIAFEEAPLTDFIEIFTKTGTHVGSESNPAAWNPNTVAFLTVSNLDTASPTINLNTPLALSKGERAAIYVVRDRGSGPNLSVSSGVAGALAAADQNLTIFTGTEINLFFVPTLDTSVQNVRVVYELDDSPKISLIGSRTVRTSARRHKVFGLVTDDVEVDRVRVRFKRQRANGSRRTVTQFLSPGRDGLFSKTVKTSEWRTVVRFHAFDTAGNRSRTARVVIIGRP